MKKKIKMLFASMVCVGFLSVSQFVSANWESGRCQNPNPGEVPCIENQDSQMNWWRFNGDGGHAGVWHCYPENEDGESPEQDFQFTGYTSLSCNLGSYYCELTLNGQVKKFQDENGSWRVGVRVNSGSVAVGNADEECEHISVGGFPWYAGHDPDQNASFPGQHVLSSTTGIVYTGTSSVYTGHVGQIDVGYSVFGLPISLVSDGNLHDVEYANASSSFLFGSAGGGSQDNIIYEGGAADNDSGCTVDGALTLQPPAQDLNIL